MPEACEKRVPNGKLRIRTAGRRGSVSGHVGSTPAREHRDAREDGGVNGSKFCHVTKLQSKSGIGGHNTGVSELEVGMTWGGSC